MQFESDYYDENPNWDEDLPDIDEEEQDNTSTEKE